MAKPAATVSCDHKCPHPKHGGGGIILTGSTNVFIEGSGVARQNDSMECKGSIDKIIIGSTKVFINGKPSARVGDASLHGGAISSGAEKVFIG